MQYTCEVVKGRGRGMRIGYPTFNLVAPDEFPFKEGVYGCHVWVDGTKYLGALHYGQAPTFDDTNKSLEIFVIDFTPMKEKKYEAPAKLTFEVLRWIRPIATFMSSEHLSAQIAKDIERIKRNSKKA